jgi:hypothetical protein
MSEVDVEKAAKRKLVSASLLMIALQAKLTKKLMIKNAIAEWKAFIYGSLIAEGAFNKLLELNHRHSKARFDAATNLLTKTVKKHYGAQLIEKLKNRPVYKRSKTGSPRK